MDTLTSQIAILVVAAAVVGTGVLVSLGLLDESYAQTAVGTLLGGSIGATGGYAMGKRR